MNEICNGSAASAVGVGGLWDAAAPPSPRLRVCIVVPVRNEAEGLLRTLTALASQRALPRRAGRDHYEVLLLANNCQDASAAIARKFAQQCPQLALHVAEAELVGDQANVGHARRLLMDAAAARLRGAGGGGVIASTDGDTLVAEDWLLRTVEAVDQGADAVGGRIAIDANDDTDPSLRRWRRCDAAYRLACERLACVLDPDPADPWPRHHQHFCGSLAVTRAAYLRVGGLPAVPHLEDEALVSALRDHDLAVRHSPAVRVVTSGRQLGRAAVGLAWQLRQWAGQRAAAQEALRVEDAPVVASRLRARARLRAAWAGWRDGGPGSADAARLDALAARWQLSGAALAARLQGAPAVGALWSALEAARRGQDDAPLVPVRTAIDGLHHLVRQHAPA